jgi:hypothetical protein
MSLSFTEIAHQDPANLTIQVTVGMFIDLLQGRLTNKHPNLIPGRGMTMEVDSRSQLLVLGFVWFGLGLAGCDSNFLIDSLLG